MRENFVGHRVFDAAMVLYLMSLWPGSLAEKTAVAGVVIAGTWAVTFAWVRFWTTRRPPEPVPFNETEMLQQTNFTNITDSPVTRQNIEKQRRRRGG